MSAPEAITAILDRFMDDEIAELERYYFYTIGNSGAPHHPVRVAGLLLRLTPNERRALSEWAWEHFRALPNGKQRRRSA